MNVDNPQPAVPRRFPWLPEPDAWDTQTGDNVESMFTVGCDYHSLDSKWARMHPWIQLAEGEVFLGRPVEVLRPARSAELLALAWTKRTLMGAGVRRLEMAERSPGHTLQYDSAGMAITGTYRWRATVRSRVGVAVVRTSDDQGGYARLIPID